MKQCLFNLGLRVGRLNQHHIWLALVVLSVALLVLGAGAPADFGVH